MAVPEAEGFRSFTQKWKRGRMVNLHDAVSLLRARRRELSEELEAVDQALAALGRFDGADSPTDPPPAETVTEAAPAGDIPRTVVKPRRRLSDEHKHALKEGRRKARHSRDVAAGRAREALAPPTAPAVPTADGRRPRLVKRTIT